MAKKTSEAKVAVKAESKGETAKPETKTKATAAKSESKAATKTDAKAVAKPDANAAAKQDSKLAKPKAESKPAAKPAKVEKPAAKPRGKRAGQMSGLDAVAKVLADAGEPMNCQQMVEIAFEKGYWKSNGKTPSQTVYSAIIREIAKRGKDSRFQKTERGTFEATGK